MSGVRKRDFERVNRDPRGWNVGLAPNVFIVGAPKCGTTALCSQLGQHPSIFVPSIQEPTFLCPDIDSGVRRMTAEAYFELYRNAEEAIRVDGSTHYLASREAPALLSKLSPSARIVVVVRDPLQLIQSLHRYRRYVGTEQNDSLEDCLEREQCYLERVQPLGVPLESRYLYFRFALFSEAVARYQKVFGEERVLVVSHADFQGDHQAVCDRVFQFLGVPSIAVENVRLNVTGKKRSEWFGELIANRPFWVNAVGYRFPKSWRSKAYSLVARANTSFRPPDPLETRLATELKARFKSDVEATEALLRKRLVEW